MSREAKRKEAKTTWFESVTEDDHDAEIAEESKVACTKEHIEAFFSTKFFAKTTYELWYEEKMNKAADLPVSVALERGLVHRCPVCRIIHPGIRYGHRDHRQYCSTPCFKARAK